MLRDKTGQWRIDKGWKRRAGNLECPFTQHRFYLGCDEDKAKKAVRRLKAFWTAMQEYFWKERQGEECLWESWSLQIAKQIAKPKVESAIDTRFYWPNRPLVYKVGIKPPEPPSSFLKRLQIESALEDGEGCQKEKWIMHLEAYFGHLCDFRLQIPDALKAHRQRKSKAKQETMNTPE